jgi:hypothetical protein
MVRPQPDSPVGPAGGVRRIVCPGCAVVVNEYMRRSHFRWYDGFLSPAGYRPYRCLACNERFYLFIGPAVTWLVWLSRFHDRTPVGRV